ncbi:MAG: hypothetical protein LBK60_08845 [Verrucomicrobiales bacterium]|nr:hypothetical protein [Verrucomicrobiales bacterium]
MPREKNVRVWQLPDGRWGVDVGMIAGKRARTTCQNEADAQEKARRYLEEYEKTQKAGETLSSAAKTVAASAIELLKNHDFETKFLITAVEEYVKRHNAKNPLPDAEFSCVVERLLESYKKSKRNPAYVRNRGGLMRQAGQYFKSQDIRDIDRTTASKWIFQSEETSSIMTRRAAMTAVFSFAVEEQLLAVNPLLGIKIPPHLQNHALPRFLSIGEMAYVLETVRQHDNSSVLASWLLQAFGGCREDEITKLNGLRWENISLDPDPNKRLIDIPYGVAAKNGRARLIPISENLYAWLIDLHKEKGVICLPNHANDETHIRELMRPVLGTWGDTCKNALRHSYATYRLPFIHGESLDTLCREMGNSRSVISRHYDGCLKAVSVEARQDLARGYWEITPQNCHALAAEWLQQQESPAHS